MVLNWEFLIYFWVNVNYVFLIIRSFYLLIDVFIESLGIKFE